MRPPAEGCAADEGEGAGLGRLRRSTGSVAAASSRGRPLLYNRVGTEGRAAPLHCSPSAHWLICRVAAVALPRGLSSPACLPAGPSVLDLYSGCATCQSRLKLDRLGPASRACLGHTRYCGSGRLVSCGHVTCGYMFCPLKHGGVFRIVFGDDLVFCSPNPSFPYAKLIHIWEEVKSQFPTWSNHGTLLDSLADLVS